MDPMTSSSHVSAMAPTFATLPTELFPDEPLPCAAAAPTAAPPPALDPAIKSAVEAQRAAALQYSDPLAMLVGIMNAKVFENQYQQEELISRLPAWQGTGTDAETANRHREMENTQRGRRDFCRSVQIEAQLRRVKRDA